MAEETIRTTGVTPIDMSNDRPWDGEPIKYEVGKHRFELLGIVDPKDGSQKIIIRFKILDGPKSDVGKQFSMFLDPNNIGSRGVVKQLLLTINGEAAFLQGQPYWPAVVGAVFDCDIVKSTVASKKKMGQMIDAYNFKLSTMSVVSRPSATPAAAAVTPQQ